MNTHAVLPVPCLPIGHAQPGDLGSALERYYARKWMFRTFAHIAPCVTDLRAFCSVESVAAEHEVCPGDLLASIHAAEEPKPQMQA